VHRGPLTTSRQPVNATGLRGDQRMQRHPKTSSTATGTSWTSPTRGPPGGQEAGRSGHRHSCTTQRQGSTSGLAIWCVGDRQVASGWPNARDSADLPDAQGKARSADQMQVNPACHDAKARVELIDRLGIEGALFSTRQGSHGALPHAPPHREIRCTQSAPTTSFLLEDWIGVGPGRFVPMAVVAYWDVERSVEDIERIVGRRSVGWARRARLYERPALGPENGRPRPRAYQLRMISRWISDRTAWSRW
jgi:hypothetical protein